MDEQEWQESTDPQALLVALDRWRTHYPDTQWYVSNRKLRLFACACTRQAWHLLTDDRSRRVVEVAERFADSSAKVEELIFAVAHLGDNLRPTGLDEFVAWYVSRRAPTPRLPTETFPDGWPSASARADLLRDIVGNPFRQVVFNPAWRTSDVLRLVQAAYEDRPGRKCEECRKAKSGFTLSGGVPGCPFCHGTGRIEDGSLDTLALLAVADVLEEQGCTDPQILRHLRGQDVADPDPVPWEHRERTNTDALALAAEMDRRLGQASPMHVRGCWVLDLLLGKE